MQKGKDKYCKHLPSLSRQTLKKIAETKPNEYCHLHKTHPIYYLCLHCGQSCCLDYVEGITCLNFHLKDNPKHCFSLQMQLGTILCSQCQDSIQNLIFMAGNPTDENVLKMNRFTKFITDIWKQLQGKVDIGKKIVVHRGLKNLGNTCFLNVVLQCLYASVSVKELYRSYESKENKLRYNKRVIPKEVQYFYDDMIQKAQDQRWNIVSSKKPKSQPQTHIFYKKDIANANFNVLIKNYMEQMSIQAQSAFNPEQILDYLGFINKKYLLTEEQDAEELLLLIVDLLSEGEKLSFLKDLDRYKEVEKNLGFQKLTPIQQVFGFYLVNQIQCNQCKEINLNANLSYNIGLGLDKIVKEDYQIQHKEEKMNIDYWQNLFYPKTEGKCELLEPFFNIQRLNLSTNYYSCSKCKSLLSWRKHYIVSQPQILVVSVKRFNAKLQKNTAKVPISSEIDVQGYCCSPGQTKYDLYGVIVHQGKTLSTGHYICFIRLGECWLLCSDHRVQVVNWKYVEDQQAYLLLYQRKDIVNKN